MKNTLIVARVAVVIAILDTPLAAQLSEFTRNCSTCILYRDQDHVWLGEVNMPIGMFGTQETAPFRLNSGLAESLAPLVMTLTAAPESHNLYYFTNRLPPLKTPSDPLLLLDIDATVAPHGEYLWGNKEAFHEVTAAEIQIVEIVPPQFIDGFDRAEQTAAEIRAVSKQAPGPSKRQRLIDLIDAGGRAVKMMADAKPDAEWLRRVKAVAPKALISRALERELLGRWQGAFELYADSLGLTQASPPSAIPVAAQPCPVLELLVASQTPAEFLDRVKSKCPEGGVEQKVPLRKGHRGTRGGTTFTYRFLTVLRVAELSPEEFEAIRDQAREALEYRKNHPYQPTTRPDPYRNLADEIHKAWGVKLREADAPEKKKSLVLNAFCVESVVEAGSPIGLRRGDLILSDNKERLYVSMRQRQPLQVLRDGRLMTIQSAPE